MNLSAIFSAWVERFSPALRYRAVVVSRTLAAGAGGYALAAVSAAFIAQIMVLLGMVRNEATTGATMLAFIIQMVAVLWVFGCASAKRAWLGVLASTAIVGGLAWMLATLGGLAV